MKKTSIVILTYNNLSYNKGVLESIRKYTKAGTYEVILVDNASTDGTRVWLNEIKETSDIKVILNDENVGFPKGCNIGITAANADNDILLLNNDIEVTHNWLDNLQIALYSNPKIGAVQGVDRLHFPEALNEKGEVINFSAEDTSEIHAFALKNNSSDPKCWLYTNYLVGYCILIKRDVLNQVGLLDERFTPGQFEDDDLSFRILVAGYYLLRCLDCFIHHFGSLSFGSDQSAQKKLFDINAQKLNDKWGFFGAEKHHQQNELLHLLQAAPEAPIHVLHIDCGLGATLFEIKNRFPYAHLYGIETNVNYANVLKNVITISTKTASELPLEFEEGMFDFIIMNKAFQQADDPQEFLANIKKYLKPDGHLIFEVQNVMHISVLKNLLNGHWHYGNQTTLNKDNRIFLTAADINILANECGYINPFVFHWFSVLDEEDEQFITELCTITGEDKAPYYRTYHHSVRFQNNGIVQNMKERIDSDERRKNDLVKKKKIILFLDTVYDGIFTKDVGILLFVMQKYYDYDVEIIAKSNDCKQEYPKNMKVSIITDEDEQNLRISAADVLYIFGIYQHYSAAMVAYKEKKPDGKIYCKLDMNELWLMRLAQKSFSWTYHFLNYCDLVTVECKRMQNLIKQYWQIEVEYIPNGYYDFWEENIIPYSIKRNIILTVGRPGDYVKNTNLVLNAFVNIYGQLSQWKLVMVGQFDPKFEKLVQSLLQKMPDLEGKIILTGQLRKEEVRKLYKEAKVFCHTSRWEACSNVLAESLGGGCYPIFTDFNGAAGLIKYGEYGTVIPVEDQLSLEESLLKVCNNEQLLQETSVKVQEYAKTEINWITLCEKINQWLFSDLN